MLARHETFRNAPVSVLGHSVHLIWPTNPSCRSRPVTEEGNLASASWCNVNSPRRPPRRTPFPILNRNILFFGRGGSAFPFINLDVGVPSATKTGPLLPLRWIGWLVRGAGPCGVAFSDEAGEGVG